MEEAAQGYDADEVEISDEDDNDPGRLLIRYLRIKTALVPLESRVDLTKQDEERKKRLQQKILEIQRDILFDREAAEARWRDMLPKLKYGLAAKHSNTVANQTEGDSQYPSSTAHPPVDLENSETDDMLSGIFNTEQHHLTTDPHKQDMDTVIRVNDFGHWVGTHPKKILQDTCTARDVGSRICFSSASSSSHAYRAVISLTWSRPFVLDPWVREALSSGLFCSFSSKQIEVRMEYLAAATMDQAEAYLSTVALFCVDPKDAGFRQNISRIPPVWREVLLDLDIKRRRMIDIYNISTLRDLSRLIESLTSSIKQEIVTKISTPSVKVLDSGGKPQMPEASAVQHTAALHMRKEWQRRYGSPAFRNMLSVRRKLPIHQHRDSILKMVESNKVSILCSDTGSGKSTQVPSFLLEDQMLLGRDCRILITQPRRISAISLARRISQELGEAPSDLGSTRSLVGYAIRMETKMSTSTRITFVTTGVLLRMLESSPELDQYDHVILDEVHERSIDLDLLFIALRRLLFRRSSLKVLLMSATVDTQSLSEYFGSAPVLKVSGRTYPVEVGFLEDAVEAVIEDMRPELQSVSGATEDDSSEQESNKSFKANALAPYTRNYSPKVREFLSSFDERRIDFNLIVHLLSYIVTTPAYQKYSAAILVFMPGLAEIRRLRRAIVSTPCFEKGWIIHSLHSTFTSEELERAFTLPPADHRKIVIATNIAETGVTIPDITAVIDTCKEKIMRYDDKRQISKLREVFISRASSLQRRGRAARVQEGFCFHLVTRDRYENLMLEQQTFEMLRLSLQEPILRVKIWNLGSAEDVLSEAINPPTRKNIRRAVKTLQDCGALKTNEDLTPLGQQIAQLPLDVELAKLCVLGVCFKCLNAAVTISSFVTSKSPYTDRQAGVRDKSGQLGSNLTNSELLSAFKLYNGWKKSQVSGLVAEFCHKQHINPQTMSQIEEQRIHLLSSLAEAGIIGLTLQEKLALRDLRSTSSSSASVAFLDLYDTYSNDDEWVQSVIAMAFYPKLLVRERKHWRNVATNQLTGLDSGPEESGPSEVRWMTFSSATQEKSGRYRIFNASVVPEWCIVPLLGQKAEFQLYQRVVKLDGGRIQVGFRDVRAMLAVKILRERVLAGRENFLKRPQRQESEDDEFWMDTLHQIATLQTVREQAVVSGLVKRGTT